MGHRRATKGQAAPLVVNAPIVAGGGRRRPPTRGPPRAGNPAEAGAVLKQAMQRGLADRRFDQLKTEIRQKAVEACREAVKENPRDAALLDNLGSALLMQGETEEAVDCYCQALAQAPDF